MALNLGSLPAQRKSSIAKFHAEPLRAFSQTERRQRLFCTRPESVHCIRSDTDAGGHVPPKLSKNVGQPTPTRRARQAIIGGLMGRSIWDCSCARGGGAGDAVACGLERGRPHAADAFRSRQEGPAKICGTHCRTLHFGQRRDHRRNARAISPFRARARSCAAPWWCSIPTAARCTAPWRSAATSASSISTPRSAHRRSSLDAMQGAPRGKFVAARRLRIHVRLRAARRRAPFRARGGARDGASDMARRPPRRSDRGELFGRGPGAGAARHRQARAIHRRDGRFHRGARHRAAHPALGADAYADERRKSATARVATAEADKRRRHGRGLAAAARAAPAAPWRDSLRPAAISERQWAVVDRAGTAALARQPSLDRRGRGDRQLRPDRACGGRRRQLRRALCRAPPRRRARGDAAGAQ